MSQKIKLGSKIRCKVTGIEGIATARVEYINGCTQYALTPKVEAGKNTYPDAIYLDYKQLEVLPEGGIDVSSEDTGGPQNGCPTH